MLRTLVLAGLAYMTVVHNSGYALELWSAKNSSEKVDRDRCMAITFNDISKMNVHRLTSLVKVEDGYLGDILPEPIPACFTASALPRSSIEPTPAYYTASATPCPYNQHAPACFTASALSLPSNEPAPACSTASALPSSSIETTLAYKTSSALQLSPYEPAPACFTVSALQYALVEPTPVFLTGFVLPETIELIANDSVNIPINAILIWAFSILWCVVTKELI